MARLNEEGQWIILMGFIICVGIFFLAILLNQSILVGQTTAESVIEFPKTDIQDLRSELRMLTFRYPADPGSMADSIDDITAISLYNKAAVVRILESGGQITEIHYNNGVTTYDETILWWNF
jgi:hypothetical protein